MEDMKMRKMMFAAGLWALSACGNVHEVCNAASECGEGAACDLVENECVTGALTIDSTGFAIEGERWWTITSEPTLKGTFDGSSGSIVTLVVDGTEVPATLADSSWTAKLPSDSIKDTDTEVTIRLSDAMNRIELSQVITLDTVGPRIGLEPSRMRDERGDAVDFSTGEPVHTHAGPELDLAATECPAVYKYGYLTDAKPTTFGRQASPNPLAWTFNIVDARIEAAAYRVRTPENQVLLDWTPMVATSGANTIELHRDDFAAFASYDGQLYLDVRARDWGGLETSASTCWEQHWLAPPLETSAFAAATGTDSLFAMSLVANSTISLLISIGTFYVARPIAVQRFVQYSTEPITLEVGLPEPVTGTYAKSVVSGYVMSGSGLGTLCGSNACTETAPALATVADSSGSLSSVTRSVFVFDDQGRPLLPNAASRIVVPGRAPTEAPRAYTIVVGVESIPDLRPSSYTAYGEWSLMGLTYTGTAPGATLMVCNGWALKCTQWGCFDVCSGVTKYTPITALDKARIDLNPFTVDVRTSPAAGIPAITPPHVPTSAFVAPALSWDAGDDDLPGAY